jgi:putative redox protein
MVQAQSLEKLKVKITSGVHSYLADEPEEAGGEDKGPNPYDLLLGALSACKIMTLELYARRKKWPLEKVQVTTMIHKEYARDCQECTSEGFAKVDIIECDITLIGDLSDEQMARLMDISERCPVHRTILGETVIRTRLAK